MKKVNEKNWNALNAVLDESESRLWAKVKRLSESYKSRFDAYTGGAKMKKLLTVEVLDIRRVSSETRLLALADVRLGGVVTVKGFSVIAGMRGIFVNCPRKPTKDGRWFDVLDMPEAMKERIEAVVLTEYEKMMQGALNAE